jgi:hypothetical protein
MLKAIRESLRNLAGALPIMVGVLMLVNLANPLLKGHYREVFTGNAILDPLLGAVMGSLSFGMPVTGYIAGGELLKAGIGLAAVTAFVLTWTSVGLVMLPLEAKYLGRRFAYARNGLNFLFAIAIAMLAASLIGLWR